MTDSKREYFRRIRVVRDGQHFSSSVNVVLPTQKGQQLPKREVAGNVYVDDYIPSNSEHHKVLGQFLSSWSDLEQSTMFLFTQLSECDVRTGKILFDALGIRQASHAIYSLGTAKLSELLISRLETLLNRLDRFTTKRNTLVHGEWTLEFVIWSYRGEPKFAANLLREEQPSDFREREDVSNIRNQKARVKHTFNFNRINAARRDSENLELDIQIFAKNMVTPHRPLKYMTVLRNLHNFYPTTIHAKFGNVV